MLSCSHCCVSDLLVRLPHQVRYLLDTLIVCWPFLQLDFCGCCSVSKIHFCSEGFSTSLIFCGTANLNVVSSTSLPSSLVIAGFWALQPWDDLPGQAFHSIQPSPSPYGKNPLFLLCSFTVGAHFPGWTLDFQSHMPLPVFPGFQMQSLFSRHLAFQACQLVSNKSVAYICLYNTTYCQCFFKKKQTVLFSVNLSMSGEPPPWVICS